jgi:hypothetical protein
MAELMSFEDRLARFGSGVYRKLRDAQAHILHEYAERHRDTPDVGIELPTGLGKTLLAFLIADEALDRGRSVAYLTGTKQLAEQVADQARQLGELEVACFRSRHYPAADLQNYHQAQAIGIMNYWVYFNSRPVPQPADLVIFDDAHIAEQPLAGLFTIRIPRRGAPKLYRDICSIVLAHTDAYESLTAMRDGAAPSFTAPELLTFGDWAAVASQVEDLLANSEFVRSDDVRWVWPEVRGRLARCGVLIGPTAIEIRPYHPPTQTLAGYSRAQQRIYLSATLGTMDDLQRRLGIRRPVPIVTPPEMQRDQTGRRIFLINPTSDRSSEDESLSFAMAQSARTPRTAWLCASSMEADEIEAQLLAMDQDVFRLVAGDDAPLERWMRQRGHLVAAGRFDGLDLKSDLCRLVILPSIPAASTEFERFVVAYLGDAAFMRHRIGQRVTQALGRANREPDDWAMYLGLDPGFGTVLADPVVTAYLGEAVRPLVRGALTLHGQGWEPVQAAAESFWSGGDAPAPPAGRRPGRAAGRTSAPGSGDLEVEASTGLWLGDHQAAARDAAQAADRLAEAGEVEHAAFWRYVQAHALWISGRPGGAQAAKQALRDVLADAPRTAWFVRLRRTLDELEDKRRLQLGVQVHDQLFLAWEEWLREVPPGKVETALTEARAGLTGDHDQKARALLVLGRLCGASADAPGGKSVADARWTWLAGRNAHRRLWEVKTGEAAERIPRKWVNQLLGQLQVERQDWPRSVVSGCLLVQQDQLEEDAAAAARDTVAIFAIDAVVGLFDQLADRFRGYLQRRGHGSAAERGEARAWTEERLPNPGWLEGLMSPSRGRCVTGAEVARAFTRGARST